MSIIRWPQSSWDLLNEVVSIIPRKSIPPHQCYCEKPQFEYIPVTLENFHFFTYSKNSHFNVLRSHCDQPKVDHNDYELKVYQDMLTYNFLLDNFQQGAKLLEIGGGESRIIHWLKDRYEFWSLDKLEGIGWGSKRIKKTSGFRLVKDYIGTFSKELPDEYFDGVFSISVLEHVPEDKAVIEAICNDIQRLLKPGGLSMHCIDRVIFGSTFRKYLLLEYLYSKVAVINPPVSVSEMVADPDLWGMSKKAYDKNWRSFIKLNYEQFGTPISYNMIWRND